MDFSAVELGDEDYEFLNRARRFLDAHVTDEALQREHGGSALARSCGPAAHLYATL